MPVSPTYPGVYIEELPSGVRTITGVATSITAFVGRAERGPRDRGDEILTSFADFERTYGSVWLQSALGPAVRDFFQNGGGQAIVVRLFHSAFPTAADREAGLAAAQSVATAANDAADVAAAKTAAATANTAVQNNATARAQTKAAAKAIKDAVDGLADTASPADVEATTAAALARAVAADAAELTVGQLTLIAAYPGSWGARLRASINLDGIASGTTLFNLVVSEEGGASESYLNLSTDDQHPRYFKKVLAASSALVVAKDGTAPDLVAVRPKVVALRALPDNATQTQIDQAQDALWPLTLDPVTHAQRLWERAKKARLALPAGDGGIPAAKAAETAAKKVFDDARAALEASVSDGEALTKEDFLPANGERDKKGLFALEQADLFNLLCIPPYKAETETLDVDPALISVAASYCERRRAMLIVDAPKDWTSANTARSKFTDVSDDAVGTRSRNAALFFPRLVRQNPLRDNRLEAFAACGAVAGIFARTDLERGVWKAPAGTRATLVDAPSLGAVGTGPVPVRLALTDAENGLLNPLGINCLRALGPAGRVVWGSRTLAGSDQLADEYKYVPVRRLALYIEESLFRGLSWVVFEPNDDPLWAQIRLNVGAFMNNLFRQGAFQGSASRDAYFVRCDKTTTTQNDINLGIVNIVVGFAPLKPAEFVILKLQQIAGQIQT